MRATKPPRPILAGRGRSTLAKQMWLAKSQERESSDSPMLNAFWRVAPSVLLSFLAICDALVFLRAIVFSSRTSPEVHARRFFFLFAIKPPFQERQLVSLMGAIEKPTDELEIILFAVEPYRQSSHSHSRPRNRLATDPVGDRAGKLTNAFVRLFLARSKPRRKPNLRKSSVRKVRGADRDGRGGQDRHGGTARRERKRDQKQSSVVA